MKKIMTKIVSVFLICIMMMSLFVACTKKDDKNIGAGQTESETITNSEADTTSKPETVTTTRPEAVTTIAPEVVTTTTPEAVTTTTPEAVTTTTPEVVTTITPEVVTTTTPEAVTTTTPEVVTTTTPEAVTTTIPEAVTTIAPEAVTTTTPEVVTTITPEADDNPNNITKDYGGYEFTFLTKNISPFGKVLVSDGETGEVLNDAIFRRNKLVEEKYNVKIRVKKTTYLKTEVRTKLMGGNVDFDAIIASCEDLGSLTCEGLLCDMLDIEQFDWNASYWDKTAKEELALGGKLFFTNCALNVDNIGNVMYFNKQIISNNSLTSPFEYMKNNEWTIDNWAKLVKSVSNDIDKDGTISVFDQMGIAYTHNIAEAILYGAGVRASELDQSGVSQLTLMKDKARTEYIYNKLKSVLSDTNYAYCSDCDNLNGAELSMFINGQSLFYCGDMGVLTDLASMNNEYGIVPCPKYDKSQENYITLYDRSQEMIALPRIIKNVERTATIIEEMNYQSSLGVVPAWLDSLAKRGNLKCEDSINTLKMLKDNQVYDPALYYNYGGYMLSEVFGVDPVTNDITQNYDRYKQPIKLGISKTVGFIKQLQNIK